MDSLFHFIFPIIAALAARVHIKHPIRNILIAAFLAVASYNWNTESNNI